MSIEAPPAVGIPSVVARSVVTRSVAARSVAAPSVVTSRIDDLVDPDSDRMLVIRSAAGDDRAFATIVRRHTPLLRAVTQRILRTSADVDDVVQETFIAAWSHVDSVIDGDTIAGWLVTTARRRSYDRMRSPSARRRADLADDLLAPDDAGPEASARSAHLEAAVRRALSGLPELQRRTWELRELGGESYREIAEGLALPVSTVRGLLARARTVMARELADWR